MEFFFYFIVFIFGACVGSFLNSIIYRLPPVQHSVLDKGIFMGRSYCPECKHALAWKDLIPLFSFLALKGQCRYCKKPISWQYPLVELATGLLFVLVPLRATTRVAPTIWYEVGPRTLFYWAISCFLIIIFVYDLKHYIIPDKVIYPAIGIAFLYQIIFNFQFSIFNEFSIFNFQTTNFYSSILSAFGAVIFFLAIVLISRGKWMGLGDVKLAFFMGLLLGFPGIFIALFLSFFSGALVGLILILFGKKTLKSKVPFAPFLVAGTLLALFLGDAIFGIIIL